MTSARFYVICTTPRSGSNFLCRELTRRDGFGQPDEFFNFHEPLFRYSSELQAQNFDDYIDKLLAKYTSSQAIFGWKAFWFDFLFLRDLVGRLNRFQPLHHIYLERHDEHAQAVSFAYAEASNSWTSEQLSQVALDYDRPRIDRALSSVRWNRDSWEEYFRANAVTPLRVNYNALIADPETALRQIAKMLDLPTELEPANATLPPLRAQREWGKEQWLNRYREEIAAEANGAR